MSHRSCSFRHASHLPIALAATLASLVALAPAGATTYTILTTVDDAVLNGNCTLREALRAARDDSAVDLCPAGSGLDTIFLPPGVYSFGGEEYMNGSGKVQIFGQTLNPFDVRIDLGAVHRFLRLEGSGLESYEIRGVEIANGWVGGGQLAGAISALGVDLDMSDFRFVSNHAGYEGGALYFASGILGVDLELARGTFLNNSASGADAGSKMGGGAKVIVSNGARAELRDLAFIGNSSAETGSSNPQSCLGGALLLSVSGGSGTAARCVRCLFQSNGTTNASTSLLGNSYGGAIAAFVSAGALIELVDCRFLFNTASTTNGFVTAIPVLSAVVGDGDLRLDRVFIDYNTALGTIDGRDVYVSVDPGGGLELTNTQISFGTDVGLQVESWDTVYLGHLTVADYPDTGAALTAMGSGVIHLHNSVISLNGSDLVTFGSVPQITNFVGGDPLFVDRPAGDYHLQALSPGVDSGTDGLVTVGVADLDHLARRSGVAIDRGCYERGGLFADDFESGDTGSWQ